MLGQSSKKSSNARTIFSEAKKHAFFDAIAGSYDLLNHILSLGIDKRWRRHLARDIAPHGKVLDIATGTGDQLLALLKQGFAADQLIGLDPSGPMLACARKKVPSEIQLIQAGAESIPLPDASIHSITLVFGLRNMWSQPDQVFQEMYRVLKPGGTLHILELTRPQNPLVSLVYTPYLHVILPLIGGLFSGNFRAYRYLARSIAAFPPPATICDHLATAGLSPKCTSLTFGVATHICAIRQLLSCQQDRGVSEL